MRKTILSYGVGFLTILLVVFGLTSFVHHDHSSAQIVIQSLQNADTESIENKIDGYRMVIPKTWYVEKRNGDGLALYPYYQPGSSTPLCKIEFSSFVWNEVKLDAWINAHLHTDPSVNMEKVNTSTLFLHGSAGLLWSGILNGVTTSIAYIPASGKVVEIAPSSLYPFPGGGEDVCVILNTPNEIRHLLLQRMLHLLTVRRC